MTCSVAIKKRFFGKKTQRNGSLGIKEGGQRRFTEPGKAFRQLEITASGFRLAGWEDVLMKWLFKAQAFLLPPPLLFLAVLRGAGPWSPNRALVFCSS